MMEMCNGNVNVKVKGNYEGLYYIPNEYFEVYRTSFGCENILDTSLRAELSSEKLCCGNWYKDEEGTMEELDDIKEFIVNEFHRRFSSFEQPWEETWIEDKAEALLESKLFYIAMEDNQWSVAVELLQKKDKSGMLLELQKKHYQHYLGALKGILLRRVPEIAIYKDWHTSERIKREEHWNS